MGVKASSKQNTSLNINFSNEQLEKVNFVYLGVIITKDGFCVKDNQNRISSLTQHVLENLEEYQIYH